MPTSHCRCERRDDARDDREAQHQHEAVHMENESVSLQEASQA